MALGGEAHPLSIGVLHSHPEDYPPHPSPIDDDMDTYYAIYFSDFAKDRPYLSLIASNVNGVLTLSGRTFWKGKWWVVDRFILEARVSETYVPNQRRTARKEDPKRTRLASALGDEAEARLREATVAVIGAGGTGSMAIEVLARAGVGRLVIVDPDTVESSNLERLHGGLPKHAEKQTPKAIVARDHVRTIEPDCEVDAYIGALPQQEVVDALLGADLALGCTDQQHSRLALSDVTVRFLVPSIDCGVMMEGINGNVTGEILQFVRFLAADACVLCRGMVSSNRLSEELMSPEDRRTRQAHAEEAKARGENPNPYWTGSPQLNTVGHLTGTAGAIVAGYAIGWITGTFKPPFTRLQMNLLAPCFDVQEVDQSARGDCTCRKTRGWGSQAAADAMISAPSHWPAVQRLT